MRILGKVVKFFGNFIGVILSLVLSLALLAMLVATPMLSGLSALTRPETIRQVVQEIDFAAIFQESFKGEMSDDERKEMEFLVELTETNAFGDLVELYATDLTNAFEETAKPSVLTKEALRKIMNDNMEELIRIVRRMGETMGEDTSSYTDAEIEEEAWKTFEEVVDRFLELAPTAEDLRNLMAKVSNEFSTDSGSDSRPNSGMQFTENEYDVPSYDFSEEESDGKQDGTITYIPDEGGSVTTIVVGPDGTVRPGGDGSITTIVVGPDGTIQSGNGDFFYYMDPETGAIVFKGGDGTAQGGAITSGGVMTFGKAVAINNHTIRVFSMGVGSSGSENDQQQEEIADFVLKLANMAKNGTLTLLFVGAIVVLSLLICLLRWPRFKGFMWVAVMLLIGAVLVALAGVAYTVMPGLLADKADPDLGVLSAAGPVIQIIANSMFVAAAIYAGVAIVLIVLFVIFRKALRKQKAAKEAAKVRTDAIQEIADEAEAEALAVEACEETCQKVPEEEELAEEVPVEGPETPVEAEESSAEEAEIPAEEEEETAEEEVPAE